jgi:heme-degrading monooxygenase HmoA
VITGRTSDRTRITGTAAAESTSGGPLIARIWRGWVRTDRAAAYVDYIAGTGIAEYRQTPGNLGAQMLTRDLGDGRTEVLTLSWWASLDSIRGFAGADVEVAVYYPEDDDYLIDRETTVSHYDVPLTGGRPFAEEER